MAAVLAEMVQTALLPAAALPASGPKGSPRCAESQPACASAPGTVWAECAGKRGGSLGAVSGGRCGSGIWVVDMAWFLVLGSWSLVLGRSGDVCHWVAGLAYPCMPKGYEELSQRARGKPSNSRAEFRKFRLPALRYGSGMMVPVHARFLTPALRRCAALQ